MADDALLNQIVSQQTVPTNQDLVDAVHSSQWANTFQNTPSAEVLRSRVDLTNTINRAFDNKAALQARSDIGALNLMQKTAQLQEWQKQAPLREQLLQAHIDATGATERRKAAEAISQQNDTAGLNSDLAAAYGAGLKPGTPQFQQAVFSSIAAHPHADAGHVRDVHKLAGGPEDVDPVAFAQQGIATKQALIDAGLKNVKMRVANGKWVGDEGAPVVSEEDRIKNKVAEITAVDAARNAGKVVQAPADKIAATEDLMVNQPLSLQFGNLKDGKLVQNTAGDSSGGKATHVNVSFVGPTGKIHDSGPITVDEYKALQKRVGDRGTTPDGTPAGSPSSHTPSEDISPVVPKTPAEIRRFQIHNGLEVTGNLTPETAKVVEKNQAALDWLKANPDHPKAAAVKAKLGL